jgi:hypothetical protein
MMNENQAGECAGSALATALRTKIAANRPRLYADPAPVRALEDFIEAVVRTGTGPTRVP